MVAVAAMEAAVMVAVAAMEAAVMVAVVTAAGMEAAVLASEAVVLADSEAVVLADTVAAAVLADTVAAAVLVDSALDVDEKKLTVDYSDYIVMYNPYYLNKIVQYRPCAFEPKKLYLINKVKV